MLEADSTYVEKHERIRELHWWWAVQIYMSEGAMKWPKWPILCRVGR